MQEEASDILLCHHRFLTRIEADICSIQTKIIITFSRMDLLYEP